MSTKNTQVPKKIKKKMLYTLYTLLTHKTKCLKNKGC